MNNVVNNYFTDAKTLVHGNFPQLKKLYVHSTWKNDGDKNQWTDNCFPAKLQPVSLQILSTSSVM